MSLKCVRWGLVELSTISSDSTEPSLVLCLVGMDGYAGKGTVAVVSV
jgi:hypothetical protein